MRTRLYPSTRVVLSGVVLAVLFVLAAEGRAFAQCPTDSCSLQDTMVSSLSVAHGVPDGESLTPVEPDTGETIDITATWNSLLLAGMGCNCTFVTSATVQVDVDWNDSTKTWSAVCTGCNITTGPIYRVAICNDAWCGSTGVDNAWGYELIVELDKTNGVCPPANAGYLASVDYVTKSVDDGNEIDEGNCSESTAVAPTSQVFSASDDGTFECNFTCAAASGASMVITYE